jgi:hypothetical protein
MGTGRPDRHDLAGVVPGVPTLDSGDIFGNRRAGVVHDLGRTVTAWLLPAVSYYGSLVVIGAHAEAC